MIGRVSVDTSTLNEAYIKKGNTTMHKHTRIIALVALLIAFATMALHAPAARAQDDEEFSQTELALIDIVSNSDTFADWLTNYPDWNVNVWENEDDPDWYTVEFYDAAWEEWLGYAVINSDTSEITEAFAPVPLSEEAFQRGQAQIAALMFEDPEIIGLIGDPIVWEYWIDYNRWEQDWNVYFYRGITSWRVDITLENYEEANDGYFTIDGIYDNNELDEETALEANRSDAINLAYNAPGVDQALEGHDDWNTYAENQYGAVWSVAFVSGDQELFFALVNISSGQVLESSR